MDSLIQVNGLTKFYEVGDQIVKALNGVELTITKGEFVALMGPSGSGKSTLMNVLGCLDTPTSGSYVLNSKEVAEMTDDELAGIRNKEMSSVSIKKKK